MFSFFPGQGLVDHILIISHGIIVGNYVFSKKGSFFTSSDRTTISCSSYELFKSTNKI
jgi:hypothetical protein